MWVAHRVGHLQVFKIFSYQKKAERVPPGVRFSTCESVAVEASALA